MVRVSTLRGAVLFRALVTDDIVAGAIECDMGGGGPTGSAAWQNSNVNELTDLANLDPISGFPVYKALLAEVTRVEKGDDVARDSAIGLEHMRGRHPVQMTTSSCPRPPGIVPPAERIYLDNNATTELDPRVAEGMLTYLTSQHGNPSSLYAAGKTAREAVEVARRQVASLIGARPRRVIFTGGGSESDNLAIKGVALRHPTGHIVTTKVEHPAVLGCCRFLERRGYTVTYLDVDSDGQLDPASVEATLQGSRGQRTASATCQRDVCQQ